MNRTLTKQRQCSHVAPSIVPLFGNPHHQLKLFVQRVICVWRDSDLKTNYTVNLHLVSVDTIRESAQIRWNIRLIPMHLDKFNYPHRNHTRSTTFWVVEIEEKQGVSGSGRKGRRWQRIRLNVTLPKKGWRRRTSFSTTNSTDSFKIRVSKFSPTRHTKELK